VYSLGEQGALWLHYRFVRGANERHRWLLAFPMPALDWVRTRGRWIGRRERNQGTVRKYSDPGFEPLRSDPRFKVLEARLRPETSCPAF